MRFTKQITLIQSIIIFLLITCSAQTVRARSVYVITDGASTIKAYDIQGDRIVEQATAENLADHDGAVGLALAPGSEMLFVTFEGENVIEMVNAKTMISEENPITVDGVSSLAGIAFDHTKQKLYVVQRGNNRLFVYLWNHLSKTLTLEGGNYKILQNIDYAYGIALDENKERLYVSNATNTVYYYDTNDPNFGYKGSIDVIVNGYNRQAVGIAVDPNRHYLYTGSWSGTSGDHTFLVRTDISDINNPTSDEYDVGAHVIGLTTDVQTGLVYITDKSDEIKIFNTSTFPSDPCDYSDPDFNQPRDIIVRGDVSYKPPFPLVEFVKDDNDVDCVSPLISEAEHEFTEEPYNWLYYNINCNANGHADTNVYITDHLPAEVNFISSEPNDGSYDPVRRTVTWYIPVMSASDSNTFRIQVGVKYYAKPGHKIFNLCEIESDRHYMYTTLETDICCYGWDIIYVDADANDPNSYHNGTSWLHAYKDLQEALHTARTCGCEQIWVAKGTYKPTDIAYIYDDTSARSISFELLDNVAIYGGFPPGGGTWPQRNPNVYETILSGDIAEPNDKYDNSYHVVKCQDVNNAVLDGFIITAGRANDGDPCCGGGIYCKDSNNFTLTNCNVSDNSAYSGAGLYDYNSSDVRITKCVFNDNTAFKSGGGMYNYLSSPTLINCAFSGNSTPVGSINCGGGLYNNQSSPTLINCTFSGNSTYYGGAVYNNSSSDPNMTNCTFANNSAAMGGAVYNILSDPNITNCIFTNNTADSSAGGMYNDYSSPTLINCTFSGNETNSVGGAIYNTTSSEPNVTNCTFSNNSARNGGALYNNDSAPNITNCLFTGNDANVNGGGVYSITSELNITNCLFTGNDAIYYGGGMYNYVSSGTVDNCIFSGNTSEIGGGMHSNMHNYLYPSLIVANCIFNGNQADYCGGGMADYNDSQLVLTNCTFSGNWAYYGGGIFSWYSSDANLTNCIFWNNVAGEDGDEIYKDDSSAVDVNYSDVKDWSGAGTAGNINDDPCFFEVEEPNGSWSEDVFYDSSTFQSTLTDEDANWAVNELAGKFVNPYTSQTLQFFIVSNDVNTIKVWSDVNDIAGEGDTYHIYDYHLRVDSPCVDTGDPNGDYTGQKDIDGEPRVFDGDYNEIPIVDMGADEYYWSPADINSDGFVNFFDYTFFASAWQCDPNDPNSNYNEDCDLEDNNSIDYNDIALFCEDWLWQTAWAKAFPSAYDEGWGRSMGMGMGEGFFPFLQARQARPELTAADIEEILKWLADLWLTNEEVRKVISEDEWLKFIEAVIQAAKQQIYN